MTASTANTWSAPIRTSFRAPLSFAQERMWFLHQLANGLPVYHTSICYLLRGALDVAALRTALEQLVARHESLRTAFVTEAGKPWQEISSEVDLEWRVLNVSAASASERQREAVALARMEIERPFDVAQAPLFRACLIEKGRKEHLLVATVHHLVFDGASLGILRRELALLYAGLVEGRAVALQRLELQYADLVQWQRESLTDDRVAELTAYWRERLADMPLSLPLPSDPGVAPSLGFRARERQLELPPLLAERVREVARAECVTPFMLLVATLAIALARLTGHDDIPVGVAVAGRPRLEFEPVIGLFVNTIVLRTSLGEDPTLAVLLRRVRDAVLDAQEHDELPFDYLVRALNPPRELTRFPLVQVLVSFERVGADEELSLPGIDVELVDIRTETAKGDFTIEIEERAGRIRALLACREGVLGEQRVTQVADDWLRVLERSTDPASPPKALLVSRLRADSKHPLR